MSMLRAWWSLVVLSFQRQARARQMVWIALALLLLSVVRVAFSTANDDWGMKRWRMPRRVGPTYPEWLLKTEAAAAVASVPSGPVGSAGPQAVLDSCHRVMYESGFVVFSSAVVFLVFLSFLLPIWSLSFATEALGAEREGSNLIWLLSRPLPRPAIYLAKFVALLPWALALNLGGFGLLCAAAGRPGGLAFRLFWPAVFWGTLAFCALFHLMGAWFRRAAIVAIVYSFFLETVLGNMPGYMKRVSISFYTRCMMFDAAQAYGLQPEKPSIYLPVDGATALGVLIGLTVVLLATGMIVFSRCEYQDLA